ncbi:diguanylate cyclase [Paenibacillus eucommiae]|uniref:Diguanylate cyclase (GGDEF)-like protein n=1 Tax=Paenibacillus eucommiae TaxID=1355755 RepID=A0ABS4J2R2_9BACL|nr:diguanylate cyclase [Paenibacillus eucommiae]MBP1993541.1 diguanylate cyclase (GGDEF)-like protein [Paenibacillus eucommiae]
MNRAKNGDLSSIDKDKDKEKDKEKENRILLQGKKMFIKEFQRQLDQLQLLIGRIEAKPAYKDLMEFYRNVHTMKGSAPIFGYIRIGKLAEELVMAWEWTQSMKEDELDTILPLSPVDESLARSKQAVHNMSMEYDISLIELEMDEQKEQSTSLMLGSMHCRLLIVDDDDVLRSYLQRRLQLDGCIVDDASDVETAKVMLHQQTYDLIMLDLLMHPLSGYELFEYLKEDPTLQWIPLIVLSGRNDLNDKVRCFHLGADDYVTKPFQYEELAARIYGLLKRTKNFEQLAFRDPLTGIFNRRYFDHQIRLEMQRFERYEAPLSLAFIDIDKFKTINDTYGHHVGDLVLQGLAHLLQTNIRNTDLLARFGGEEFVIVLPNSTEGQTIRTLQAILEHARKQPVAQSDGLTFSITFSAGVAEWQPGMPVQEWLSMADAAMYKAKQQGRNRVYGVQQTQAAAGTVEEYVPPAASIKKRLLVVDDDLILRSILISHLQHLPIQIVEASDGEEAYEILQKEHFDVCILDGMMPRMDGFTLLEKVRLEEELSKRDMRILILSGKKKEDDLVRGYQLGADDYMTKPFSLVELEMRVRRMLRL